ncbi:MAG TPA: CPBP family intramembrane glutamic endopeptidase, partial [Candidatus Dormibacteraeota bacterium]|nr:CPBP family intramembrane glutamic endopeptidase [Candidatus Dormibacteraeota bacterium]
RRVDLHTPPSPFRFRLKPLGHLALYLALVWVLWTLKNIILEFTFRGYTLHALAESIGFWPAAILFAAFFGLVHSFNPGEGVAGELGVVAIALIFAFTLLRTGTLWLAVGWHAAFDFGETFLFSVPDSGSVFPGHLANSTLHGPAWLTGGSAGPEASVFSFAIMAALTIAFHFLFPPQPQSAVAFASSSSLETRPPLALFPQSPEQGSSGPQQSNVTTPNKSALDD